MDELGIEISGGVNGLPTVAGGISSNECAAKNRNDALPVPATGADAGASAETDELEARLRNLKR